MLTPSGMRQRFLLGRYNREKHEVETLNHSHLQQIDIQSTDVYRTIQSGYSELLGIDFEDPETEELLLTDAQVATLTSNKRGMPAFNLRRASSIISSLGDQAIVDGFINKPIYTYIEPGEWIDLISSDSCSFVVDVDMAREKVDSTYEHVLYLRDDMKALYGELYNLTQEEVANMTYYGASRYADALFSERFEGVRQKRDWTEEEEFKINNTLKYQLLNPFTSYARKLMISKLLEKPIMEIEALAGISKSKEHIPYHRIYSAHDTQVANVLAQIAPDFSFDYIPYASNIFFQLRSLASDPTQFYVKTVYNGVALKLKECDGKELCGVQDFLKSMKDFLIINEDGLLQELCSKTPTPDQLINDDERAASAKDGHGLDEEFLMASIF
mmetsp:Transcript_16335/g.27633  ORF Transcript_16335/g.27633 Transcript_16335/m.27633 type:complete len:385 (-) Transcript_16335:45-1199(-)